MRSKQLPIPGLEGLEEAMTNAREKQKTVRDQIRALSDRILALELEVSLLRILLEEGEKHGNDTT